MLLVVQCKAFYVVVAQQIAFFRFHHWLWCLAMFSWARTRSLWLASRVPTLLFSVCRAGLSLILLPSPNDNYSHHQVSFTFIFNSSPFSASRSLFFVEPKVQLHSFALQVSLPIVPFAAFDSLVLSNDQVLPTFWVSHFSISSRQFSSSFLPLYLRRS